jgi:hypothetical protein
MWLSVEEQMSTSAQPNQMSLDPDVPAQILEISLDQWLDSFPIDKVQAQLAELERTKGTIEAAIESLNRRLAIWAAMREHQAGFDNSARRPSKRDAVVTLLERDPYREFAASEIRDKLIEDGLLEDSKKARHALEMTLSNMVKRGEAVRPRKGFYKLSPSQGGTSVALTDLRCEEGDER